jgi:hypothetical protein
MSALQPLQTTWGDLCKQALKDSGAIGTGQSPGAEDISDASIRGQWMLQEWERESYLIYHLVTYLSGPATGQVSYSIGPTGKIPPNGPILAPDISIGQVGLTSRPNRIESAFFRQQILGGGPNVGPIDYPLRILPTLADYNRIAYKTLQSFSLLAFYDPAWPLGLLYPWPVPSQAIYSVGITVREQLPSSFASLASVINLPFEYYAAIVANLGLRLRPKYGLGTFPGDMLPQMAKSTLLTLRKGNTNIPLMELPPGLSRGGLYNIYSDENY